MSRAGVTLALVGGAGILILIAIARARNTVDMAVDNTVEYLARRDVTADDVFFARATLLNPIASDGAKQRARNLLAALDFQRNLNR